MKYKYNNLLDQKQLTMLCTDFTSGSEQFSDITDLI